MYRDTEVSISSSSSEKITKTTTTIFFILKKIRSFDETLCALDEAKVTVYY